MRACGITHRITPSLALYPWIQQKTQRYREVGIGDGSHRQSEACGSRVRGTNKVPAPWGLLLLLPVSCARGQGIVVSYMQLQDTTAQYSSTVKRVGQCGAGAELRLWRGAKLH